VLKRFSIDCYGKQPTLESMRMEKSEMFEKLKNKKGTEEYERWFLKYSPKEQRHDGKRNDQIDRSFDFYKTRKNKKGIRRTRRGGPKNRRSKRHSRFWRKIFK